MATQTENHSGEKKLPPIPRERAIVWTWGAILLTIVVALALRFSANLGERGIIFDEVFSWPAIHDLLTKGWSVETAIDFAETKGPGFIWPYAIFGQAFGLDLQGIRWLSILCFVAGVAPLIYISRLCGLRGAALLAVTGFYILLPHNAVVSQLVMSEPSYFFGSLCLMATFLWGFTGKPNNKRTAVAAILFGIILSILLHNRVHAVAFASAVALVSFERDRMRSWPWWLACALAGVSRIPLWIRWGGLVAPEYHDDHPIGFSPESITYLAAAMSLLTVIFIWPALTDKRFSQRKVLLIICFVIGLVLALIEQPDLRSNRFLGAVATTLRAATDSNFLHAIVIGTLAVVGITSLGALGSVSWSPGGLEGPRATVARLLTLTLASGCALYGLAAGSAFDRYLLSWTPLLPIVWVMALPRGLQALQAALLLAIAVAHTWRILF